MSLPYTITNITTLSALMVSCTMSDWKYSPISSPSSMCSMVSLIDASAESSTAVPAPIRPPAFDMTCCATSNTAIVMVKQFVIRYTATAVLNTHLKNIQVSKFARLLWAIMSCMSS